MMTGDRPEGLNPRNTTRGRPRTGGTVICARCGEGVRKARVNWPEGKVCGPCFTRATRTYGVCPGCSESRLLPGPSVGVGGPTCSACSGIAFDFRCTRCGHEGQFYRRGMCARCALHDDLADILLDGAADPDAMTTLVAALCKAQRPESIFVWKRSPKVRALLRALATGATPLTHDGLDNHDGGREVDHLRALLVQSDLLPPRDPYLARFEQWITDKLEPLPAEVARPVEQFATWHHLRRVRTMRAPASSLQAPVHAAKQEITETARFLSWLWDTHHRPIDQCTQGDVDAWLAAGPTTRTAIRTFIVFANKVRLNTGLKVPHRLSEGSPSLTQDQRLAWLDELLTGTSESLPYRVAGTLRVRIG